MIQENSHTKLTDPQKNTQGGFTLVEIAVVMIIASLIIAALVSSYVRWNDLLRSSKTKEHISIVSDALSAYVSRNYRVPCPANPAGAGPESFGYEIGSFDALSGAQGAELGSCANLATGEVEGVIPFKTLGVDAEIARDGWGNFFTYQVDPVFTQDMYIAAEREADPVVVPVHAKCRTLDWIEGATIVTTAGVDQLEGGRNVAMQKARFCCVQADPARQIQVFSSAANDPAHIITTDSNAWYDRVNQIADPNFIDASNPVGAGLPYYNNNVYGGGGVAGNFGYTDRPVFVLISHGKNESGAFLVNGTPNRRPNGGALEIINADATTQTVYNAPHDSSNDASFYDDIVFWQTQSDLMARLRRDSCALP